MLNKSPKRCERCGDPTCPVQRVQDVGEIPDKDSARWAYDACNQNRIAASLHSIESLLADVVARRKRFAVDPR